jgi:hypothetical protein
MMMMIHTHSLVSCHTSLPDSIPIRLLPTNLKDTRLLILPDATEASLVPHYGGMREHVR